MWQIRGGSDGHGEGEEGQDVLPFIHLYSARVVPRGCSSCSAEWSDRVDGQEGEIHHGITWNLPVPKLLPLLHRCLWQRKLPMSFGCTSPSPLIFLEIPALFC